MKRRKKMTGPHAHDRSPQLRQLIESCSHVCEAIFRDTGELHGMYHVVRENGENTIIPAPPCDDNIKDLGIEIIRHLFREMAVVRYVFVAEAWLLVQPSKEAMEQCRRLGVRNHPERQETVIFTAEDSDWTIIAHRMIKRLEGLPPCLAPLTFLPMDEVEGRMVGLLTQTQRNN
jgi:hypothetical protein